jgi:hypothetical protein
MALSTTSDIASSEYDETIYHNSFSKYQAFLEYKFETFNEDYNQNKRLFGKGIGFITLIEAARDVWLAGVELTRTPRNSSKFYSAKSELLENSSIFNYFRSLTLDEANKIPESIDDIKELLRLVDEGISRYYIPGLYHVYYYSLTTRFTTDGLKQWDTYKVALHPKVEQLCMSIGFGKWIESELVNSFTPLEVPDYFYREEECAQD